MTLFDTAIPTGNDIFWGQTDKRLLGLMLIQTLGGKKFQYVIYRTILLSPYVIGRMWLSNTCDKDMQWRQGILHFNKLYSKIIPSVH